MHMPVKVEQARVKMNEYYAKTDKFFKLLDSNTHFRKLGQGHSSHACKI